MSAWISIDTLSRTFGDFIAVNAISLDVQAGEVFGLLGPHGAGKSTTISMLTTLPPSSGCHASIAGVDLIREQAQVRRIICYVPQAPSADGALTGDGNLLIFAKLSDLPCRQYDARAREALDLMGLAEVAEPALRRAPLSC